MGAAMVWALLFSVFTGRSQCVTVRQVVVPTYPHLAWMAHLQGVVSMQLEIGQDGKVESVKASGADALLRKQSEDNVRLWTFGPFCEGTAFPVRLEVKYTYKLEGDPEYYMSQPKVLITLPNQVELVARPPKPVPD